MSTTVDMSNNAISDKETPSTITENTQIQNNLNYEKDDDANAPVLDTFFSMDFTTMLIVFAGIVIVLYLFLGRLFGSSSGESAVSGFIG
jgi:hypothetical protein